MVILFPPSFPSQLLTLPLQLFLSLSLSVFLSLSLSLLFLQSLSILLSFYPAWLSVTQIKSNISNRRYTAGTLCRKSTLVNNFSSVLLEVRLPSHAQHVNKMNITSSHFILLICFFVSPHPSLFPLFLLLCHFSVSLLCWTQRGKAQPCQTLLPDPALSFLPSLAFALGSLSP